MRVPSVRRLPARDHDQGLLRRDDVVRRRDRPRCGLVAGPGPTASSRTATPSTSTARPSRRWASDLYGPQGRHRPLTEPPSPSPRTYPPPSHRPDPTPRSRESEVTTMPASTATSPATGVAGRPGHRPGHELGQGGGGRPPAAPSWARAKAGYSGATTPRAGVVGDGPGVAWLSPPPAVAVGAPPSPKAGVNARRAVGLSGQMHGVVAAGVRRDAGGARRCCGRTRGRSGQAGAYLRPRAAVRRRLANPLSPGMAGPMLAWLAAEEPGPTPSTRHALQPKDWLRAVAHRRRATASRATRRRRCCTTSPVTGGTTT